jgi:hypothetical protein
MPLRSAYRCCSADIVRATRGVQIDARAFDACAASRVEHATGRSTRSIAAFDADTSVRDAASIAGGSTALDDAARGDASS